MRHLHAVLTVIVTITLAGIGCTHSISDNFTNGPADFWDSGSKSGGSAPWAYKSLIQGKPAYCFVVKSGDHHTKSDLRTKETERSEIYLKDESQDPPAKEVWYSYKVFIPSSFPKMKTRLVIGQWKADGPYSPSISNRYENGKFRIQIKASSGNEKFYLPDFKIGEWNELTYKIVFDVKVGELDVWLNDRQVVLHRGATAIAMKPHLFKMGLYRDAFSQPMEACFADFKKSSTPIISNFKKAEIIGTLPATALAKLSRKGSDILTE